LRHLLILAVLLLGATPAFGAVTIVQVKRCPSSSNSGTTNGALVNGAYTCPLPNKTLANNLIDVRLFWMTTGTAPTVTVTDSASNAYTQDATGASINGGVQRIYHSAGVGAGVTWVKASFASNSTFILEVAMVVTEWSGVNTSAVLDVAACNTGTDGTSGGTPITSGSMTIGATNELIVQHVFGDPANTGQQPPNNTSFAVGSQANITWTFRTTDRYESNAVQSGVFASSGAFNPTFSQGTAGTWASCAAAYKTSSPGGTAASGIRIISVTNIQNLLNDVSPVWQVPLSGNLIVIADLSGGTNNISAVSSTPSCTWSNTGTAFSNGGAGTTILWYSLGCAGSNTMTITPTLSGTIQDNSYLIYDVTSPNSWTFDVDSGGQSGTGVSPSTQTICSACLTPSTSTGLAVFNYGESNCTANLPSAPSGSQGDNAFYTGTTQDGPTTVDENNGWMHLMYSSSPGAITATLNLNSDGAGNACATSGAGAWVARGAAWKTTAAAAANPGFDKRRKLDKYVEPGI